MSLYMLTSAALLPAPPSKARLPRFDAEARGTERTRAGPATFMLEAVTLYWVRASTALFVRCRLRLGSTFVAP